MGIFVVVLCLKVQSCTKAKYAPKPVLDPKTKEQIVIKNNQVQVTTDKGTTTINGSRETKVDIQKDGTVKITEKTLGWEHQIGANAYGGRDGLGVGLDLRFAYYKNFDALTGIGYLPQNHKLDLWLGASYTIHNSWVSNTALFMGYSIMSHAPVAGLSLRF